MYILPLCQYAQRSRLRCNNYHTYSILSASSLQLFIQMFLIISPILLILIRGLSACVYAYLLSYRPEASALKCSALLSLRPNFLFRTDAPLFDHGHKDLYLHVLCLVILRMIIIVSDCEYSGLPQVAIVHG